MTIKLLNIKKIYAADFYLVMGGLKRKTILGYPHIIYWKKDDITIFAYNKLFKTLYFDGYYIYITTNIDLNRDLNKAFEYLEYLKHQFQRIHQIKILNLINGIPKNFEYELPPKL